MAGHGWPVGYTAGSVADERRAAQAYAALVAAGHDGRLWDEALRQQIYLGDEAFVDLLRQHLLPGCNLREFPQPAPQPVARPLAHFADQCPDRDSAITTAYASGGYTMKAIGDYFGLHYSRVSTIVRLGEDAQRKTRGKI